MSAGYVIGQGMVTPSFTTTNDRPKVENVKRLAILYRLCPTTALRQSILRLWRGPSPRACMPGDRVTWHDKIQRHRLPLGYLGHVPCIPARKKDFSTPLCFRRSLYAPSSRRLRPVEMTISGDHSFPYKRQRLPKGRLSISDSAA